MTKLLQLNNFLSFLILFFVLVFNVTQVNGAEDIWKKKEDSKDEQKQEIKEEEEITIESPILSENINKIKIKIDEEKIDDFNQSLVGIFDPEENNFNLHMWSQSDGQEIKKILKRINKLKLSKLSEDMLFEVLFTNAYPPEKNLSSEEFLKIKINWLIKNKRFQDLENLLKNNPAVGKQSKTVKLLVNEYLSSADIKSACEKTKFLSKEVKNDYLDKFTIYCLINDKREDEAQILFDLMKERGVADIFFENKFYYLLGVTDKTNQKILDKDLLSFYLSHITVDDFNYEPTEKTNKYIWRYLSAANLISTKNFENEEVISTYEKAASENSFKNNEVFKIYLQMSFSFNQLANSTEIYKNLPSYKARALLYQSLLLTVDVERKIFLAFLLKDLFKKDNLLNVYEVELSSILKTINPNDIPENYSELVSENLDPKSTDIKKIKFNNDILHRSKVIRHFLDNSEKTNRTKKDFKTVYKKIKRNKKYFISIMDIIVLESLAADGIALPSDLDYGSLSSELTVPKSLDDLVKKKQIGMVMLKIIEIIGEDKVQDLDPETIYFLNKILNELNLKKIRNNILSKALPVKV
tara:strand:+ start:2074 stop:3819 length:1746 start_codon:yes stop_codon:yes gene_type:complete